MRRYIADSRERFRNANSGAVSNCEKRFNRARVIFLALNLLLAFCPIALRAQGPALTTISDTVYRADGTPASGVAVISWPSFQTAEGDAVAAGNQSVAIGGSGAFLTQLVPNVGASPAGTYYVVVFQLDDGTVRTEYWAVPSTSPTSIAAIRTTPGTGLGNMAVTQQYVNTAVANRAIDSTVVHLSGTETITGAKQFAVAPSLPPPAGTSDATNKAYVDAAVGNVGSGSYVSKAGDTMTGPLTLPGPPTAPNQASDRQYVDNGLAAKADLISGVIPAGEIGNWRCKFCHLPDWQFDMGILWRGRAGRGYLCDHSTNWSQTISGSLTGGAQSTVTLTPCPMGIDTTSGAGYQVLITSGGNSEAVKCRHFIQWMHIRGIVGNDHIHSILFLCIWIYDWVGILGNSGNN